MTSRKRLPRIFLPQKELEMNTRIVETRRGFLAKLASGLVFAVATPRSAYATEQISVTAHSGEVLPCHFYYRVDANGKEWPVTIQFTSRPKNGTATTQTFSRPVSVHGQTKTVHAVKVFYQSKSGFVGQDSFTYRRTTADPTDPDSGKEYMVAVTVR
jgi:hypothetical protein